MITILLMLAKTPIPRRSPFCAFLYGILQLLFALAAIAEPRYSRAGAHVVDISPAKFPVIVNAMFTERTADKVTDPLFAKALVLDDGATRVAMCVVDTCMVPRDLIDRAKEIAAQATGIPVEKMLVSATHTHSAPSAMGCLGSRVDPEYAAALGRKERGRVRRIFSEPRCEIRVSVIGLG